MAVYFRLYNSTETTLLYTFPVVFSANYPHTENQFVEHTNFRGKGSLIINGGEVSWDLTLKGVLFAANYEALISAIDTMESSVPLNTKFLLKINKTSSTYYTYKCKRVEPIQYEADNRKTDFTEYVINLKINSW